MKIITTEKDIKEVKFIFLRNEWNFKLHVIYKKILLRHIIIKIL